MHLHTYTRVKLNLNKQLFAVVKKYIYIYKRIDPFFNIETTLSVFYYLIHIHSLSLTHFECTSSNL
jgi:hypothetical protein